MRRICDFSFILRPEGAMQCPKCRTENPEAAKFCIECANPLEVQCANCGVTNPARAKFCMECAHSLKEQVEISAENLAAPKIESPGIQPSDDNEIARFQTGERKQVTVLFSDLSGYTAMSERIDPEEVKEIVNRIFGQIKSVIAKYEGFIEKFAGDAVMAIFGVPRSHEDDPVRAIKAAKEIHDLVANISPELEDKIKQPLSMHSGINTGLAVTGDVNPELGTHGVSGDALNLASRLSDQAGAGEILVGYNTYHRTQRYFSFQELEPTTVKGKAEPISVYKVLSGSDRPDSPPRSLGLSADLIGRDVELTQLKDAFVHLRNGKGSIISIVGDAGTGKSRLVEEFRSSLDSDKIQWLQGHAYSYSQNMTYFPLIDLLSRTLQIEEGDPPDKVRQKIETGIEALTGDRDDIAPYIGSLYALDYPELSKNTPELWKTNLQQAVRAVLANLTPTGPTIVCLEDLQWSDPSTIELLRFLLSDINNQALFICTYRLPFSIFTSHQLSGLGKSYQEIILKELSASEAQRMVESMLNASEIPPTLPKFIQEKLEGNPFYIEEVINAMVESNALIRDNGNWKLTRSIDEMELSSTIYGVITGRLDRLENETKRVLQEASVIGRTFLYEILKRTSELKSSIDHCLNGLERLDLIKARSIHPDLEYFFKHAMTQEVAYNGLLKKERRDIHERVGLVMEDIFHERLPELYETLAYHFKQGRSFHKAVEYLVKSGEKSLERYSVEEAHQFYQEAYDILTSKSQKTEEDKSLLIDLMNSWGYVFYYLGDVRTFTRLFEAHRETAESLNDTAKLGMFNVWLGIAIYMAGKMKDADEFLRRALEFGEKHNDQKVIGYACTWLSWIGAEMGNYAEGKTYGDRAQKIAESFPSDQYLFFKSFMGLRYINFFEGKAREVLDGAQTLLKYGKTNSNNRSLVFGHWGKSLGHFITGDLKSAIRSGEEALNIALDPLYSQFPKLSQGILYLQSNQLQEAEDILKSAIEYCEKYDVGQFLDIANLSLAPALVASGRMKEGLKVLEDTRKDLIKNQRKSWLAQSENILGIIYSQVATGPKPTLSTMAKNIGFLARNVPQAGKKAEEHFKKSIEMSKELGAGLILGSACLNLGLFYKNRKKPDQATQYLSKAIKVFEDSEADVYLNQAKEALTSLTRKPL
jgi:class 3 adenylate cyclase/tetratricopeptide (TPR) repeat protein